MRAGQHRSVLNLTFCIVVWAAFVAHVPVEMQKHLRNNSFAKFCGLSTGRCYGCRKLETAGRLSYRRLPKMLPADVGPCRIATTVGHTNVSQGRE